MNTRSLLVYVLAEMMTETKSLTGRAARLGDCQIELHEAGVRAVAGGAIRRWAFVASGLRTVELRAGDEKPNWINAVEPVSSDWLIHGLIEPATPAKVVSAEVQEVADHRWMSDHLVASCVFGYDMLGFDLRWRLRVYPGVPSFQVGLALRARRAFQREELPAFLGGSFLERLSLPTAGCQRVAAGYYNDTQHRNFDHTPILRQQSWSSPAESNGMETCDWANLISLERDGQALTVVKESHKCVNESGCDTGAFVLEPDAFGITGLGLTNVHGAEPWWREGEWVETWATWWLLHPAGIFTRQRAVKAMDRARYPFRPKRDTYVMANTWGSRGAGHGSRSAAEQANILREIESCADLGIDLLQIDDGWQCEPDAEQPTVASRDWLPHPLRWPDGWGPMREHAAKHGVTMGLWFNSHIDTEKMITNADAGGFKRFKLDFATCRHRHELERLLGKARRLCEHVGPDAGVNWDTTEQTPRVGYFVGREYGNLYTTNRENGPPPLHTHNHIRYTTRLILRDAWHLSHYLNLNQVQIPVQNKDLVFQDWTNCSRYTHAYHFAIAMMGLPIFFQETWKLGAAARNTLRPLIASYKQYRDAILAGTTYPLGEEPNDRHWTGFQSHDTANNTGYLLAFREIDCRENETTLNPPAMAPDAGYRFETVVGTPCEPTTVNNKGVRFSLPQPGTFTLVHYRSG